MNTTKIVVTRHSALRELLIRRGLIDESTQVFTHVTEKDVKGKHVIGVLPLALAALAETITEIPLNVPVEMRGRELTLQECERYAGASQTYKVSVIDVGCICNRGEHEDMWREGLCK